MCSISGCFKENYRNFNTCVMHYARIKKYGDPNKVRGRWDNYVHVDKKCTVDGCNIMIKCGKLCSMHRTRLRNHGDVNKVLPHKRDYHFNEKFMDELNEKSAYVLGWIITDGHIDDTSGYVVAMHLKDLEPLNIIRDLFNHEKEPKQDKNGHWKITLHSKYLYTRFLQLGLTNNKTFTVGIPEIPEKYLSHFIRGCIEGDGSISHPDNPFQISINSASENFINRIKDLIPFKGSFMKLTKNRQNPLWRITYSGPNALKLGDWMYKDSENLRLTRKYERYLGHKSKYQTLI